MLVSAVRKFFNRHLHSGTRIIIGLSGGADSMALLLALNELPVKCIAAHCNFHLRGDESNRDQAHCESLCLALDIPLLIKEFNVHKYCEKTSDSIEMACRRLRYDWWEKLISDGVADYIAVGHHKEDNIETFFLNLFRGSGITGLKAMLPVNNKVIRPLLDSTRYDIESYVTSKGYNWVVDSTNRETEYKRNRLRNIMLPLIEREFPGSMEAVSKSIDILRDNYSLYKVAINSISDAYIEADGAINILKINNVYGTQTRVILHELLIKFGLSHSQIDNVYECAINKTSGQIFHTKHDSYILERGILKQHIPATDEEVSVDITQPPFCIEHIDYNEFCKIKEDKMLDNKSIYMDSRVLENSPKWTMRTWRNGDRLKPFGMNGSRLVSDIYSDLKLSSTEKNSIPLLFRNGELIWIAGIRSSRHFPVTPQTTDIIRVFIKLQ